MPTYTYRCDDCATEFEVTQRITDSPLRRCRDCGGKVERVIHPVGIIFKGPGFHVNDYPNSKGAKRSATDPKPSEKKDSADTGSSDSTKDKYKDKNKDKAA